MVDWTKLKTGGFQDVEDGLYTLGRTVTRLGARILDTHKYRDQGVIHISTSEFENDQTSC